MPPARRHMVLTLEAMVQPDEAGSRAGIYVAVNGCPIGTPALQVDATSTETPAVHGRFALDVDVAEARHPGRFRRRPLAVELFAFDAGGAGFTAGPAVLRGNLEKKAGSSRRAPSAHDRASRRD